MTMSEKHIGLKEKSFFEKQNSFYSIAREVFLLFHRDWVGPVMSFRRQVHQRKYQMWPSSRHETQRGLRPSWRLTATFFYKYGLLVFPTMVMIVEVWNYARLSEYLDKTPLFLKFILFAQLSYMIEYLILAAFI